MPVGALRDLLGLARAIYATRKEHGAGKIELEPSRLIHGLAQSVGAPTPALHQASVKRVDGKR